MTFRIARVLALFAIVPSSYAQLQSHQFYTSNGRETDYQSAVETLYDFDVVLMGELHDHALIHWIEKRMIADLMNRGKVALGGEFFERDDQLLINELLEGRMNHKRFEAEAKLWPNYATDYRPILQLAIDSGLTFTATNIPRRYASMVASYGLDTLSALSEEAKRYIAELPVFFSMETPGYSEMLEMMGGHGGAGNSENFVMAQAVKDATMAESILKSLNPGVQFIHINGDFHSAHKGGIYYYLKHSEPSLKVGVVKVYSEDDFSFRDEWKASGDIILVVADDFTRTH